MHENSTSCPSVTQSSLILRPRGLLHAGFPCPSLSPGVCSNSPPLSRWCYPNISSSVSPFSSCPKSFPASGSFPVSQLFASGGQSTEASVSASVLPRHIQNSFGIDWFDLAVQRTLKSLLQHHGSKASILWPSLQSNSHILNVNTGKTRTFVGKAMSPVLVTFNIRYYLEETGVARLRELWARLGIRERNSSKSWCENTFKRKVRNGEKSEYRF